MAFLLETEGELICKAQAQGQSTLYAKKGSMIAYQGNFKFDKVLLDPNGAGMVRSLINHASRRLTGENMELMKVTGEGYCFMADEAQHVTIINLEAGNPVSVESENLLAFTENVKYGVRMIGVGVISQKGLFTSKLEATGYGAQVAVKTDGNPLILQTPCVVDPDAVVCWTGPDPSFKLGVSWKTLIGQTSGESYMLEFKQPGGVVIIQPSERLSGLKVGVDDNTYQPETQQGSLGNTMGNLQNTFGQLGQGAQQAGQAGQQFVQNQGQGQGGAGGVGGLLGQLFGNRN